MNITIKMQTLLDRLRTLDLNKIYEIICLSYVFLYCISKTNIFDLANKLDSIRNIVFVIAICRVCYLIVKNGFSKYILTDIISLLFYAKILVFCTSNVHLNAEFFYDSFVLGICVLGVKYKKVVQSVSLAFVFVILYSFITSFTAIVDSAAREYTRTYGDTTYHIIRSGWGVGHENTLGIICFLATSYFCIGFDKISKVLRSIVAFGVAIFVWIIPNSRFNTYLLILLGVALFIDYAHDVILNKKVIFDFARKLVEVVALVLTGVIPFLMMYIILNYEKLSPALLQKLDSISSGRISLGYTGYKDMGFSLWGQYNATSAYLDSGWIRLPVFLGIPMTLFVIVMLVYIGIKAFEKDDFLLVCFILLVSVSSICYEIPALEYWNLFLILPFASYAEEPTLSQHVSETDTSISCSEKIKQYVYTNAGLISVILIFLFLIFFRKTLISTLQTQIECTSYTYVSRTMLLLLYIFVPIMMVIGLCGCIRTIVRGKRNGGTESIFTKILIASSLIFVGVHIYGYCYINSLDTNGMVYEEVVADEEAMNILGAIKDVDVVSQVKPYLYKMYYDFPNLKWLPTADYARFDNITVILDIRDNYRTFSHTGFVQTPISEYHKIYTNDSRVIEAMEAEGYVFTYYSQYVKELDLGQYAKSNELKQAKDGSIIVKANEDGQVIKNKAPEDFVDISNEENKAIDEDGNYNLHIVLEADSDTLLKMNTDDTIVHILISFSSGIFLDYRVKVGEFKEGVAICDIPFSMWQSNLCRYNTQFTIDEAYTIDFTIKEISYYRTE